MVRLGGWLFKRRTWLPLPLALTLLLLPAPPSIASGWAMAGGLLVAAGEAIRLWGVHHIGVVSRTRSDRLGPLVRTGPFAYVRNPLYLGNLALWTGFALSAHLVWMAPVLLGILGVAYHAIVRWEEGLLESRLGDVYRVYAARVARWRPSLAPAFRESAAALGAGAAGPELAALAPFTWRETLFSERGTLAAIAAAYLLLALKFQLSAGA